MPEDSKKNKQKVRNDPKEQRRPRQRHQAGAMETKIHKKEEEIKAPIAPPNHEEPGPDFYKNLKRETDEILKITEEENQKYKKKEIQSNWSKYEMPMESYDEIEEHENMGADYEKLIEAPQSIGGYFQFKHEKSWDVDIGPSPYDKFFEINMDDLFLSVSTIPFYNRDNIQKEVFTESDILNMNNRATKFKQKYSNDKVITTPESDEKINTIEETDISIYSEKGNTKEIINETSKNLSYQNLVPENIENHEKTSAIKEIPFAKTCDTDIQIIKQLANNSQITRVDQKNDDDIEDLDDILNDEKKIKHEDIADSLEIPEIPKDLVAVTNMKTETEKIPVIESPEDLEKWLDDFLDG
ncbi:unnamed protein product [Chilo suppressalis]|uniref:Uncharacterized protein n=1 Tax=Chilo suppressalis TaxID=168631 RepID=A0ABN8B089_CHISP|nr:unnamed protein product [Chilo suppressalis]